MSAPHRVLIIEDNDDLRETTALLLRREGFEVETVPDAESVDPLVPDFQPELFIIDINLPGENGLALSLRLRQRLPRAGILITSARTALDDRVRGYDCGADLYLPKPVAATELLAALRAVGKRAADGVDTGLWLLERTQMLGAANREVSLSAAETRLLAAFAKAEGQTLERIQVAALLSPDDRLIGNDSLQVRLSQLRRKLAACGVEGEQLRALRGVGYRLEIPIRLR